MYGHLNPIQRSRCGVPLLTLREYETAYLGVLTFPKMTSVPLSGEKNKREKITYKLEGLEAKSIKYRCIRVPTIIIVIMLGVSNACGTERYEKSKIVLHGLTIRTYEV